MLELLQELGRSLHVHKQRVNLPDVSHVYFGRLALLRDQVGSGNQVDGVTQRALLADLGEQLHGAFGHFHVFFLASDVQDLADLLVAVGSGRDDKLLSNRSIGRP